MDATDELQVENNLEKKFLSIQTMTLPGAMGGCKLLDKTAGVVTSDDMSHKSLSSTSPMSLVNRNGKWSIVGIQQPSSILNPLSTLESQASSCEPTSLAGNMFIESARNDYGSGIKVIELQSTALTSIGLESLRSNCQLSSEELSTTDDSQIAKKTISVSSATGRGRKRKNEDLPLVCGVCNKRFRLINHLKMHYAIHTVKVTTFKCPECEKSCCNRGALYLHMRKHTAQRAKAALPPIISHQQPTSRMEETKLSRPLDNLSDSEQFLTGRETEEQQSSPSNSAPLIDECNQGDESREMKRFKPNELLVDPNGEFHDYQVQWEPAQQSSTISISEPEEITALNFSDELREHQEHREKEEPRINMDLNSGRFNVITDDVAPLVDEVYNLINLNDIFQVLYDDDGIETVADKSNAVNEELAQARLSSNL